jgi:hypothetical protein
MEAVPLPQAAPLPSRTAPSAADEWGWVYDDPDLAPFRTSRKARPETPLTAWA